MEWTACTLLRAGIQQIQRGDANALGVHFPIHPLGQGTPGNLHVSLLYMLNLAYTSWT